MRACRSRRVLPRVTVRREIFLSQIYGQTYVALCVCARHVHQHTSYNMRLHCICDEPPRILANRPPTDSEHEGGFASASLCCGRHSVSCVSKSVSSSSSSVLSACPSAQKYPTTTCAHAYIRRQTDEPPSAKHTRRRCSRHRLSSERA